MIAKDIMTRAVRMIGPKDNVQAAARVMAESGVSALPVVDDAQRVLGIVSEGDLLRRSEMRTAKRHAWWREFLTAPETLAAEYIKTRSRRVLDVMSRPVISVTEQTPLPEIASIMEQHKIKRVPVLQGGTIVGIVSRADVVRAFAQMDQPSKAHTDDHSIRNTFLQRLKAQPWASAVGVTFAVSNGSVMVHGVASSEEQKRAMTVMAETIPGVREVRNEIVVAHILPVT